MVKHFRNVDWFWLVYLIALSWLWYPLWAQSQIPAFRDGFHFYYPQFYWLEHCYRSGEFFPKWNPNEGLGVSVWGQPTWQIFYPLRVLWLLPLLSLPQLYAIWIIAHQIVAVLGMKRLAAEYQLSHRAGWLAGISFSLGCPVLFQYSNSIYLCSAAWIGWALIPITRLYRWEAGIGKPLDKMFTSLGYRGRSQLQLTARVVRPFALACSMMLLSGDPHTAVNAVLIGFACFIWRFLRQSRLFRSTNQQLAEAQSLELEKVKESIVLSRKMSIDSNGAGQGARTVRSPFFFAASATATVSIFVLVALQTIASWNWYGHSSRAKQPMVVTDSFHAPIEAILKDDGALSSQRIFDFSISPWSLPSLVWPTIGGFYQPVNTRWVDAIESESRLWIPSLYVGLLPLLLGLGQWHSKASSMAQNNSHSLRDSGRILLGIGLVALLAAMGNYSLVWLVRQLLSACGLADWTHALPADSSGSLYGLITLVVPGYDSFRYPAKWIVWVAAGLSFSAAIRFDHWFPGRSRFSRLRLPAIGIGLISFAVVACCFLVLLLNPEIQPFLTQWLGKSIDPLLGQANAAGVVQEVLFALHWPIAILSLLGIGIVVLPKRTLLTYMLLICMIDLLVCARHWITTTPEPPVEQLPVAGRSHAAYWANVSAANIADLFSDAEKCDQTAQIELQESFLMGKLGHLSGVATLHASGPLRPQAVVKLERWLSLRDTLWADQPELDEVLGQLSINHRLIRSSSGEYQWKDIESVRPLCEIILSELSLLSASPALDSEPTVDWSWTSNSSLSIRVSTCDECTLLVRQLNDGGWKVDCSTISQLTPSDGELFIALPLPSGSHVVHLSRWGLF